MNLAAWIKSYPITERFAAASRIADECKVTVPAVRHWANGNREPPLDKCPSIESATAGAVRCEELRPDVPWTRGPSGEPLIDASRWIRKEAA